MRYNHNQPLIFVAMLLICSMFVLECISECTNIVVACFFTKTFTIYYTISAHKFACCLQGNQFSIQWYLIKIAEIDSSLTPALLRVLNNLRTEKYSFNWVECIKKVIFDLRCKHLHVFTKSIIIHLMLVDVVEVDFNPQTTSKTRMQPQFLNWNNIR